MINELNYNALGEIDYTNTNIDRMGNYFNNNYFPKSKVVNKPEFDTKPLWKNGNKLSTENYLNTNTNLFQKLKGNFQANSANMSEGMEKFANIMGATNPTDAILKGANVAGDLANGLISTVAKPGSKAFAYSQGSQNAQNVVTPLAKIPVVGEASKLIAGLIGGSLSARKAEFNKDMEDDIQRQLSYQRRNTLNVEQPDYYGQYMAKYGANPKMMEQRIIDDIYSDFDKYLKLT